MNPNVDIYLIEGCGRCAFYQTPKCKVNTWRQELIELRRIANSSGLKEEYKWSQPCYTHKNNNVIIVSAMKDYASMAFFKGALLKDPRRLLISPGKSSQASRQLRFTSVEDILKLESTIKSFILCAIQLEEDGKKIEFKKHPEPLPEELLAKFEEMPTLRAAFESLTPGRQRGYILNFSQPKQSKTRFARIERYIPTILEGKGIHDDFRASKKK